MTTAARFAGQAVGATLTPEPAESVAHGAESVASFVRHELRNTLTAASLHAAMLSGSDAVDEARRPAILSAIRDALDHALALSDRLGGEPMRRPRPVEDAAQILRRCARLVKPVVERAGALEIAVPDALGRIAIDEAELGELTINLLINAGEALVGEGTVRLFARKLESPGRALIEISDDGCGMNEETLDGIFAPGFSGKPGGSGLGLARVNQIAQKCAGTIEVVSAPGAGTTFRVELPLVVPIDRT